MWKYGKRYHQSTVEQGQFIVLGTCEYEMREKRDIKIR